MLIEYYTVLSVLVLSVFVFSTFKVFELSSTDSDQLMKYEELCEASYTV